MVINYEAKVNLNVYEEHVWLLDREAKDDTPVGHTRHVREAPVVCYDGYCKRRVKYNSLSYLAMRNVQRKQYYEIGATIVQDVFCEHGLQPATTCAVYIIFNR